MLVDRIPPVELEVPHEPGNFFTLRALSAIELDAARREQRDVDVAHGILSRGLVSWRGETYDGRPVEQARDLLDEMTRDWAATEIFGISRLKLGEALSSGTGSRQSGSPREPAASSSRSEAPPPGEPS